MSKAREVAEIMSYTDAINTSSIEESGNLYFTNQRGIDSGSATYILQTSQQGIINSASAAAVVYADGLTTTDVAEDTSLYYTNARGQQTASTMFVHGNHTNVSAQYVSGEIRLTSSAVGGGGGGGGYATIEDDGVAETQRTIVNFVGFNVEDNAGATQTDITNVYGLIYAASAFR